MLRKSCLAIIPINFIYHFLVLEILIQGKIWQNLLIYKLLTNFISTFLSSIQVDLIPYFYWWLENITMAQDLLCDGLTFLLQFKYFKIESIRDGINFIKALLINFMITDHTIKLRRIAYYTIYCKMEHIGPVLFHEFHQFWVIKMLKWNRHYKIIIISITTKLRHASLFLFFDLLIIFIILDNYELLLFFEFLTNDILKVILITIVSMAVLIRQFDVVRKYAVDALLG